MDNVDARPGPPSGAQWTIVADGHEAVVVEVGGGLRTYRADGFDYIDGYGENELAVGGAGQVLAPWPNRIRDGRYTFGGATRQLHLSEPARHNAIHGLTCWLPWQLIAKAADEVVVGVTLAAHPGYPWSLVLRTRWQVSADGLRVTHQVTNASAEPAPFGLGVHPYLRLPATSVDDMTVHLPARSRLLVDSRLLPIGAAKVAGGEYDFGKPRRLGPMVLDTAFGDLDRDSGGGSAVTLSNPEQGSSVAVWADSAFGWWQMFTGDALPEDRRRRSVAVEPMTCPPDAFRSGRDLLVLEPAETWQASWGIRPGVATPTRSGNG
ncbi:aldose 1-epimerase family protein [Solwaraspora sp. WMMD406]|uniref:aldose 1-epimerase family protein n=1 Tax=Solwaraspora sp. WMMD406 TaxID=3016095 RepID=UPI002417916C|nr:aldose 1-epimerase family protein [Solwaraspora sp. WMMD406]MDG4763481.1 aldose 1-epimerase family protein [Solwaraspora sp. WMMD406]